MSERWLWLAAALVIAGLATGHRILLAFGGLVAMAGGLSWLWNRLSLRRVSYERRLSQSRAFIGETVELTVAVTNRKVVPLPWIEAVDEVPEGLELEGMELKYSHRGRSRQLELLTSMAGYERVGWRYRLRCTQRGYFELGPVRLRSGDLFGFQTSEREEPERTVLLVYPQVVPLEQLGLPSLRPLGEAKGGPVIYEDPARLRGLRDYTPGDPMRRVDWKASARHGRLRSRLFDPTVARRVTVVLNLSTFEQSWEGYDPPVFERLVTAAASAVARADREKASVGLLANGRLPRSGQVLRIGPSQSPRQLARLMEALAMVGPFIAYPMEVLLESAGSNLGAGDTVLYVTAMLREPVLARLRRMGAAGALVVVLFVGREEPPPRWGGFPVYNFARYLGEVETSGLYSGHQPEMEAAQAAPGLSS
ncbi:MAG: DUF58 domain-containing protein [Chloroflexi bacterium]|nr:DUF58 domain-containing protein [Chloroflexota bacterium]